MPVISSSEDWKGNFPGKKIIAKFDAFLKLGIPEP